MSEENNDNTSKIKGENNESYSKIKGDDESTDSSISKIENDEVIFTASTSNEMKEEPKSNPSIQMRHESKHDLFARSAISQTDSNDTSLTQTNGSTTNSSECISASTNETSSSEGFNCYQIEESVLDMIKNIEEEIEAEGNVGLNENKFQNIEMKIKTSRVMAAIEQTIQKLEIAFCLPYIFVENMHDMNVLCGDSNVSKLMNEYCKIRDAEDLDICRFQPAVINCINSAYEAGFRQFVDHHQKKMPEAEAKLLSTMVQFKCMAEWQMEMSAIKAMNKEKTLHKMWTKNEKIKTKISEAEEQFENYREKMEELVNERNRIIATHNRTIADLEQLNSNDINTEIYKSNQAMRRVCLTSEEKQKALSAELEQIKETYEKLVLSNLNVEKKLRDQKSKTRQRLQAVLTKYDTGVGERFTELMRIRNELEDETVLYENKVKEFQLQEIEYNQIMADKAEVDAKVREEKLLLFMMNRSARIIQRAYKKMMKKRKKGKKGKKGKK